MAALLQQCSGGPLGVVCGSEFTAFEAVESTIRGKEPVSPVVPGDDACGPALDFDDVSLGHVCSFTGGTGVPVWFGDDDVP
jgi:hypothetical protein